jgi:hypothetical protein
MKSKFILIQVSPFLQAVQGSLGKPINPLTASDFRKLYPVCVTVNLSLCLANWALRHEYVWRSGCIDPRVLDLGISWRWVISFTPQAFYSRRNRLRYPLDRRFHEPRTGLDDVERRKILPLLGFELQTVGRRASSQSLHFCVIQQMVLIYFIAASLFNNFLYSLYPLCLFRLSLICVHSIYFRNTYINDSWLHMFSVCYNLTYNAIIVCSRVCVLLIINRRKNDREDDT